MGVFTILFHVFCRSLSLKLIENSEIKQKDGMLWAFAVGSYGHVMVTHGIQIMESVSINSQSCSDGASSN